MHAGRLLLSLALLAGVAGRAASQAPLPQGSPCPPVYAPAPRIRVIVPPPEVIFRPCSKPAHPVGPCPAPCAAPAAAAPAAGNISFNMNYAMPMGAQMSLLGTGLGGLQQAGGLNLGLGGLGNSGLAAALGLNAGGVLGGGAGIDPLLLRLLLGRAQGNGGVEDTAEAQLRRLIGVLTEMRTELAGVREMRDDINRGFVGIATLNRNMVELEQRLRMEMKKLEKAIEDLGKNNGER